MSTQSFDYKQQYQKYRRYYGQRIGILVQSKQTKAYSMLILSILTISFFGMFAIRPTVKTIMELYRQINDSKTLNEAMQKKIDSLVIAQDEYQLVKDFVPAINEAIPTNPQLISVLLKIEDLANENSATITGIQVETVTYNKTEQKESQSKLAYEPVNIELTLKLAGNYKQMSAFMDRLFTMRRTVNASSLEFILETGQQATLRLLLNLDTYYLK